MSKRSWGVVKAANQPHLWWPNNCSSIHKCCTALWGKHSHTVAVYASRTLIQEESLKQPQAEHSRFHYFLFYLSRVFDLTLTSVNGYRRCWNVIFPYQTWCTLHSRCVHSWTRRTLTPSLWSTDYSGTSPFLVLWFTTANIYDAKSHIKAWKHVCNVGKKSDALLEKFFSQFAAILLHL